MPRTRVSKDSEKKSVRPASAKLKGKAKAGTGRKGLGKKAVKRTAPLINEPLPSFEAAIPSLAHGHAVHLPGQGMLKSQDRRRQQLILTVCVSVVMVVIMAAWIVNLKRLIEPDPAVASTPASAPEIDFEDLKKQLTASLSEVKGNLDDLKPSEVPGTPTSAATPAETQAPTSTIAPSTISPSTLPATLP